MQDPVYTMIHQAEEGWWYRGRKAAVASMLARSRVAPKGRALDYGAGYGAMRDAFPKASEVDAFEVYPDAAESCKNRGYVTVHTKEEDLDVSPVHYDTIGAFDVIEHIENDASFFARALAKLTRGGILVATVPAHQFLFGPYDTEAHHFRRYAKKDLRKKLKDSGFTLLSMSYWNASLFPVALILRLFGSKLGGSLTPSPLIDKLLGWVVACEGFVLRFLSLPMGLSIVFVAQKNK